MSYITKISVGTKSLNFAWNIQNFKGRVKKRGEGGELETPNFFIQSLPARAFLANVP